MNYYLPFVLSFLIYFNCNFMTSAMSFVNKDIRPIFDISKFQLGIIYGVQAFWAVIGLIIMTIYTQFVRKHLITILSLSLFVYTVIHLIFVVGLTLAQKNPHKALYYLFLVINGLTRASLIPTGIIVLKIHKQKHNLQKQNHLQNQKTSVSENSFKLITMVWGVGYEIGNIFGYLISNLIEDTLKMNWRYSLVIGSIFGIISSFLIYKYLKPYIQDDSTISDIIYKQISPPNQQPHANKQKLTLPQFFLLLKQNYINLLLLVNINFIQLFHNGVNFTLAPYLHSSGYNGTEGFLMTMFNVCTVLGSWLFGVVDFYVNKIVGEMKEGKIYQNKEFSIKESLVIPKNDINKGNSMKKQLDQQTFNKNKIHFHYSDSISLFLFVIISIIIFIDCLIKSQKRSSSTISSASQTSTKQYLFQMILISLLGLFLAGPTKSYFGYHCINLINDLQKKYGKYLERQNIKIIQTDSLAQYKKKQPQLKKQQPTFQQQQYQTQQTLLDRIIHKKYEISIFLININHFLLKIGLILFLLVSFWLIQKNINYLFAFYSLLGGVMVVFDVVINMYTQDQEQEFRNDKVEIKRIENGLLLEGLQ